MISIKVLSVIPILYIIHWYKMFTILAVNSEHFTTARIYLHVNLSEKITNSKFLHHK